MARIEGFRLQNFRALKDVTLGKLSTLQDASPLEPLTAVIGRNGSGKSSLFDAFGFLSDCLSHDVETACDLNQRGGFDRLRSKDSSGQITFEIYYRETPKERPITYEVSIDCDRFGRPYVASELLKQRRKGAKYGRPYPFLRLQQGRGRAWAGEEALEPEQSESGEPSGEDPGQVEVTLTDPRLLGIATLGTLQEHPRIKRFRDFLKSWYLSYFTPDAARSLPTAGPQRHLNRHGDNLGNVVQYMEREQKARFQSVLSRIAERIPGVDSIETKVTDDKRVLLKFNDGAFRDPFFAQQMSDGTLKLFAYLLMLEDPDPSPFICIEEPENGLYPKLLEVLAGEFRSHASGKKASSQLFVTTHQPYFVDALKPEEVWVLEKGESGYSSVYRASDSALVKNLVAQELPLGSLWFSDYLERVGSAP